MVSYTLACLRGTTCFHNIALACTCTAAAEDRTSKRDSGHPIAPDRIRVLLLLRPAWLPTSRTHSCSSASASDFTPNLK